MNRRNLFALPFIGLLFGANKTEKYRSEFGLGEYKSHFIRFNGAYDNNLNIFGCGFQYVNFPIENHLEIKYENGIEEYISFNIPKQTIKEINEMSIEKLMSFANRKTGNDKYTTQLVIGNNTLSLNSIMEL